MASYNNKSSAVTNIKLNLFSNVGVINLSSKLSTFLAELGSSNNHNPEQSYIMYRHGHGSYKVIMFPQ